MKNKVLLKKGDSIHFDLDLDINIVNDSKYEYDRTEFRLYIEECVRTYFLRKEISDGSKNEKEKGC